MAAGKWHLTMRLSRMLDCAGYRNAIFEIGEMMYLKYFLAAYLIIGCIATIVALSLTGNTSMNQSNQYIWMFIPFIFTIVLSFASGVLLLRSFSMGYYGAVISQALQFPNIGSNMFLYYLGIPVSIPVAITFPDKDAIFSIGYKAYIYFLPNFKISINSYENSPFIGCNLLALGMLALLIKHKDKLLDTIKYNKSNYH